MDGVSLEMEKWKKVLTGMGHEVDIVAGNAAPGVDVIIPEIEYNDEANEKLNLKLYGHEPATEREIREELSIRTSQILGSFRYALSGYDLVIPNNIWSLGWSIPSGLALHDFAEESGKSFISHNHDFWWDRPYYRSPHGSVMELLNNNFPPDLENVRNLAINSISASDLLARRGIRATVVPNVMDFRCMSWVSEENNRKFRSAAGIDDGDIVFLQATRITERKAVETAIRLTAEFRKIAEGFVGKKLYSNKVFTGRTVLVLTGLTEKQSLNYRNKLDSLASRLGVEVIDISSLTSSIQQSFFESYSIADIVVYPTVYEGWGNQLLEALFARKPIALFRYSVFKSDIQDSGISFVDLGDQYSYIEGLVEVPELNLKRASEDTLGLLFDPERYREVTESNFELGSRKFSFETLSAIIRELVEEPL